MGKFSDMGITVIGEANIDIAVKRHGDFLQGGCTPAEIRFHYGGVARNIAHNLSLLGQKVRLMSVFGGDDFATRMMIDCQNDGIDLSLSTVFEQEKSPVFLSFNDETGNMQSALSDIGLNSHLNLDWLKGKIDAINRSEFVVADTLLTAEALTYLIDSCEVPLYIDTVSPKRAMLLSRALATSKKKSFAALKCNQAEALALANKNDVTEAAKTLNDKGIREVFVTLGEDGVIYGSQGKTQHFHSLPAQVVDVVGSGDAFLSGVVFAHANGIVAENAVQMGLEAARITVECEEPCSLRISELLKTLRSFPNKD